MTLAEDTIFDTGMAITPKNFPHHSTSDLDDAFRLAAELGKYSVFISQWHELDIDIVKLMMDKSRQAGLVPILGLSPTSPDQGRKELDIPETVRRKAGHTITFANPVIRKAFVDSAMNLAQLKPPYLCLATEINFLAIHRLDEFLHFVTLYKEAYRAVKKVSPDTQVFVSFQWEWVRILDAREMHRLQEHSKVINIFKPELDQVGLTTYPSTFHDGPQQLPIDYYTWIYHHIDRKDPVMFMEAGWPTQGSSNASEQKIFITRLPQLLKSVNTSIVAWALLHDVNIGEFDANLNSVGLLTSKGKRKIAFEAFKSLHRYTQ